MAMQKYRLVTLLALLAICLTAPAQRFFNLTSDEVSVDSILPTFTYTVQLPDDYQDSVYTSTILYPEFIDMTETDIANYHRLSTDALSELPQTSQAIILDRRQAHLSVSFCPLVLREGKYQILVSFMLRIDSKPKPALAQAKAKATSNLQRPVLSPKLSTTNSPSARYASHSVLRQGTWAKIRVPSSGVYELTSSVIRRAGFSDLSRVRIYGYGGNLQNEVLDGNELQRLDDLQEVPTCTVNGRRLFYARGPVSWSSNTTTRRTRNPYSDYGYYFITQDDSVPASIDSTSFINSFYPSADDYHTLYERDGFSWYHGGRNLFDSHAIANGATQRIVLANRSGSRTGRLYLNITSGMAANARIELNDSTLGTLNIYVNSEYDQGNEASATYTVNNFHATDTVKITALRGGPLHLDYVSATWDTPAKAPDLTASFPAPEYVYNITNQDHHADPQADMVIIIPTSQKLLAQAQRLAAFHEQHDSLRVNILPADELYNEFASGTPDANAYRRYMKMLYDRAETDADMPKYLLLFGDGVWDNRMLTPECKNFNADDYLLCYESENSFNELHCYVDDGFFGYLDDGEGVNLQRDYYNKTDLLDVAVGRFTVTTEADAKIMVDKTISYVNNANAGTWQNTIVFMGDDGNNNTHMRDANAAAEDIAARYPNYQIKKVMWDAYTQETSSTGNRYPEVSSIIKQQQQQGALIMDYMGHGRADWISHEAVLTLSDFHAFTNKNLPLWITASCDIMAFDGVEDNIGEAALLNGNGGAIAFFGTTRTVQSSYNRVINMAYLRYVLGQQNGKNTTIGEAARLAKNLMITTGQDRTDNKLQYTLLGDPAIALNAPTGTIVIDSINGQPMSEGSNITLEAGSVANVKGHVEGQTSFNGIVTLNVLDSRELVTCRQNPSANSPDRVDEPFKFYNRTKSVYEGSDSIVGGRFNMSFAVPLDLNYANNTGRICAYAVNNAHSTTAHGSATNFILGGTGSLLTDTIGPKIYCYLNDPEFQNGGSVNATPYFVARLSDSSGINATSNGIGHNLELIIDGDANKTYSLNDNFAFDFGSYTSGSTYYNIPSLEPGRHSLLFRAWDTMNNASTATLDFNVVKGLKPSLNDVNVSRNPATTTTTFIVSHNFGGSLMDVTIDVFDMSGRLLWTHAAKAVSTTGGAYTLEWNLTQENGGRLPTGVYLYRARIASDGSATASKAKKLIVINNN